MHKEVVAIYSHVVHQPSGIRRFWFISIMWCGIRFEFEFIIDFCKF